MLGWKRLLFTLATAVPLGLLLSLSSQSSTVVVVARSIIVGLVAMLAFGLTERWPARMPNWLARWVLQLIAVVVAVPLGALLAYWVTLGGSPQFGQNQARVVGYISLTVLGIMVALWIALGAMVRQRDELARNQALAFELERSELARQALDTRMHLLQAQVQPHFLIQHVGQRTSARRNGFAAGVEGARESDRLPSRRSAAPARPGNNARPGVAAGAGLS